MSKVAKRPTVKTNPATHMPFDEFTVKDLDHIVQELDRSKPAGAVVEVSAMEGSLHSPCMAEMQAVVVQSAGPEGRPAQTFSMYQFCPVCKTAVRVL